MSIVNCGTSVLDLKCTPSLTLSNDLRLTVLVTELQMILILKAL